MEQEQEKNWVSSLQRMMARWEIILPDEAIDCFKVYVHELDVWNNKINLTALKEPEHIALGHFADSIAPLTIDNIFKSKNIKAVDIGTGAGFPGLPLKIVRPDWHMTLVESINKKCEFLKSVVGSMELNHVDVVAKRSEEIGWDPKHREKYDFAFARALSSLSTLIEYGLPLLKVGGYLVAHRGRTAADEASRVNMALSELGGSIAGIHHYEIPGLGGSRAIVLVRKDFVTSKRYPRRIGVASKRPL